MKVDLKISPLMEFFWQDKMSPDFPNHFHDHYVIGCLLRGERFFQCGGIKGRLFQNQIMIINPGQAHKCESYGKTPSSWLALHFSVQALRSLTNSKNDEKSIPFFKPLIWSDNIALEKLLSLSADLTEKKAKELLNYLFENQKREAEPNPSRNSFPTYINLIYQNFKLQPDKYPSLEEMAYKVNMSKYTLIRKFKDLLGISPYRYLEIIRLNLVRQQLCKGRSLSQCAQSFGYYDQSHMTRQFTNIFGFTPGCLKKAASVYREKI